jgi:hypothetical protein
MFLMKKKSALKTKFGESVCCDAERDGASEPARRAEVR